MITKISAQNIKSWRKLPEIELGSVTGLFGTNSSGKSTILQILLMLKQTKDSTDRSDVITFGGNNSYFNFATFDKVVHNHDDTKIVGWSIAWDSGGKLIIGDPEGHRSEPLFQGDEFEIQAEVYKRSTGEIATRQLTYRFDGHQFRLEARGSKETAYGLSISPVQRLRFRRTPGRAWDLPGPIRSYAFPDQTRTYFQNAGFLADLEYEYEDQLDHIFYLGPLRDFPKREYLWSGSRPLDVGSRGERTVDAILAARADGVPIGRGRGRPKFTVEEYVAYWLKELGLIHSFEVEEIAKGSRLYRVAVKKNSASPAVDITDVGFGVSQLLPILVLLYYIPEGSTVLLEQPEIHLHPSVQTGLADILIDASEVRGIQTIVESHSEHLLRRLQRRIAEKHVDVEDIKLYFCSNNRRESKIVELDIDIFGNIQNWPDGFFGDEYGEIIGMQEAILQRKSVG